MVILAKAIKGKDLKGCVDWLMAEKCGCCHFHLLTDDKGRKWSVVVGWSDGFEENEEDYFSDGTYQICTKIAYQESNNIMQCDFDIDFTMPYNEETSEVCDTCSSISRSVDWSELAEELLKEFKEVTDEFAFFEEVEEDEEVA